MSEPTPDPTPSPVVALIEARRDVLTNGPESIGMQGQKVAQMQAALDAALACLASCEAELAALDHALDLLNGGAA
jgi:hypothetical protein